MQSCTASLASHKGIGDLSGIVVIFMGLPVHRPWERFLIIPSNIGAGLAVHIRSASTPRLEARSTVYNLWEISQAGEHNSGTSWQIVMRQGKSVDSNDLETKVRSRLCIPGIG
jgi:hypothetical protein